MQTHDLNFEPSRAVLLMPGDFVLLDGKRFLAEKHANYEKQIYLIQVGTDGLPLYKSETCMDSFYVRLVSYKGEEHNSALMDRLALKWAIDNKGTENYPQYIIDGAA